MKFAGSLKAICIVVVSLLALGGGIVFLVHWEIDYAKKHLAEKAKQVVITPAKLDSTAKTAGRIIFEVKNFKKKIHDEAQRLQDSSEAKK